MTAEDFRFSAPKDLSVFVCSHVWEDEAPILYVSHDGDGDWQFLCGGTHEDSKPVLVCLEHVVDRDASLNEVSDLLCNHTAERNNVGAEWEVINEGDAKLQADVAEHGWHVVIVRGDDEGPGFAYSVGLKETFSQPELIMFGLTTDLMHALINDLGEMLRCGQALGIGEPIRELLRDADCVLYPMSELHRVEYLRYACWYYDGSDFEALQCFWPSKDGQFPWEPGCDENTKTAQPDLRDVS